MRQTRSSNPGTSSNSGLADRVSAEAGSSLPTESTEEVTLTMANRAAAKPSDGSREFRYSLPTQPCRRAAEGARLAEGKARGRKLSRVEERRSCAEHGGAIVTITSSTRPTASARPARSPPPASHTRSWPARSIHSKSGATSPAHVVTGDAGALRDASARGVGAHFPAGAHVGVTGPDGAGCELDAVEHELRRGAQQVFVLGAAGSPSAPLATT
jgi:hypothetical protein